MHEVGKTLAGLLLAAGLSLGAWVPHPAEAQEDEGWGLYEYRTEQDGAEADLFESEDFYDTEEELERASIFEDEEDEERAPARYYEHQTEDEDEVAFDTLFQDGQDELDEEEQRLLELHFGD